MRTVQGWLDEYGESHINPLNKAIHWVCVPLIVASLVGLLWSLPVPPALSRVSPLLNWGVLFMLAALVYYSLLSFRLALGMLLFSALLIAALHYASGFPMPLWQLCVAVFVIAWIGQFIGHMIEGRRPSFFKDVQFLLIGPIWLMGFIYRRLGIRY